MELCAALEENRHWTGPHTVLGVERPRGNLYTFNLQHLELVTEVYYLALTVEKISRDLPPLHPPPRLTFPRERQTAEDSTYPCNCTCM